MYKLPMIQCDFYKCTHYAQYPKDMIRIVSYLTPRMSRVEDKELVMFGLQYFIKKYMIEDFNKNFFSMPKKEVMKRYRRMMRYTLGENLTDCERWESLYDLGYLPLEICAVPEGTRIPMKVPMIQITNTHSDFMWLVNHFETALSVTLWHMMASANVGYKYRKIVEKYYNKTVEDEVPYNTAIGDFSMRGQESIESATTSSAAFLLSFVNTATIPAIEFLENYYNADIENEIVGKGLTSTEHSVVCSNYSVDGNEKKFILRLLTEIYPHDNFTMVSDSYDYWNLVANIMAEEDVKEAVLNHNGFIGIRGDCYDDKTEILTNNGWKLFKDLCDTDLVAQYSDGYIEFVKPLRIIDKEYVGKMYNFSSEKYGLNLCVTPNHRMVYSDKGNSVNVFTAENAKYYNGKNMVVCGEKVGTVDHLSDYERLMIAFQADGRCRGIDKTEQFSSGYTLEFNFSKERKINRLKEILDSLNIGYKIVQTDSGKLSSKNNKWKDEYVVYVKSYKKPYKKLSEWVNFENKSSNWCKEFVDEVSNWDGHVRKDLDEYIEFDNTDYDSVNIVYTASVLSGYKTRFSIKEDNRSEKYHTVYRCFINKKRKCINGDSIVKNEYDYNGKIYCVTVPSGMILVRRDGQCVISGNSGNPVDIICGNPDCKDDICENLGTVSLLWSTYGGTINSKGYKVLDEHIKVVYGDSITPERAEEIYRRLEEKGFAANNVSLGMGSYSMQSCEGNTPMTRDTYSIAVKSTYGELEDGTKFEIFKNPKTDNGHFKKSQKGCCVVYKDDNGNITYKDGFDYLTAKFYVDNMLIPVFKDGKLLKDYTLEEVRNNLHKGWF